MWMSIDVFKSCTQTPKSVKIFWKGQGILKSWSAGHPVVVVKIVNFDTVIGQKYNF